MAKEPGFYLYTGDWKKDPLLSMCQPSTRGIWVDILCAMHDAGRVGSLSGTVEQFAAIARCQPTAMRAAIDDLSNTKAAGVTWHDAIVTLTNWRMSREAKARESSRKRMKRHRSKEERLRVTGDVAPPFMPSSLSSSSSEKNTTTTSRARNVTSACQEIVKAWNAAVPQAQQVPRDGTPAIDRAYSALALAAPPVDHSEILEAVENYYQALKVRNSQAYAHSLGQFLRRENIDKYLPGTFNLANYDRTNFGRDEQSSGSPEQLVQRLKAKGQL